MKGPVVLIPVHNESRNIAGVIRTARKYLPVLVVDDGSTDNTADVATNAGAEVIRQVPNQGKGVALLTGFKRVIENGYSVAITLDGDGQHDPDDIPAFLNAWQNNQAGLIIGRRNFTKMPITRYLANSIGRIIFSLAVGQKIDDNQSGYRLITRKLMVLMLTDNEPGFEFEVDMIVVTLKHKFGIDWVPIRTIYTGGASHIKPVQHIFNFIRICHKAHLAMKQI